MITAFALTVLLPGQMPEPDVAGAERLYEQARYDAALRALGPACDDAVDFVHCERVRAFIHIALGNDRESRAAFDRMLAVDPESSLGPDVSPKLQGMFGEAKQDMLEVQELELDITPGEEGKFTLEVAVPVGFELAEITAYLAADGRDLFQVVELSQQGSVWAAETDIDVLERGPARYYLVAGLASGVGVSIGTEDQPLQARVGGGDDGKSVTTVSEAVELEDAAAATEDDGEGLPPWAFWGLIGAGAAVVIGVVIGIVVATSGESPGAIQVGVVFSDDP